MQACDPHLAFQILAPPILFYSASMLPRSALLRGLVHVGAFGVVGVGTGSVMTAEIARYILPFDFSWFQSLLFGAIVAATDPVAAVALLQEASMIVMVSLQQACMLNMHLNICV